jgi:hypothetical protein
MKTGKRGQTVVLGYWQWGAADTLPDAKRNFQAQHGRVSDGYMILVFDADTEFLGVDDVGRYHYRGNAPTETLVKPRGRRDGTRTSQDAAPHIAETGPVALANQSHPTAGTSSTPAPPADRDGRSGAHHRDSGHHAPATRGRRSR